MGKNSKINYQHIPSTIFTNPELASVGLTEEQTKQLKLDIKIGRFPFRASGKAISLGKTDGFVKIIVDKNSLRYLVGTELDFVRDGLNSSFKFNNPNVAESCGCGESFSLKKELDK